MQENRGARHWQGSWRGYTPEPLWGECVQVIPRSPVLSKVNLGARVTDLKLNWFVRERDLARRLDSIIIT